MQVWLNILNLTKVFNFSPYYQKLVMEIISQSQESLIKKWGRVLLIRNLLCR